MGQRNHQMPIGHQLVISLAHPQYSQFKKGFHLKMMAGLGLLITRIFGRYQWACFSVMVV
jgi:hypothetical protein